MQPQTSVTGVAAFLAAAAIFLVSNAAAETPADSDCMQCHSVETGDTVRGAVDYSLVRNSAHGGLACVECHSWIKELPHIETPVPVECLSCHQGSTDIQGMGVENWLDSVHGRAAAAGDSTAEDAANCTDCHGKHDIRGKDDPKSMVFHGNIPLTCARCHEDNQVVIRHDIHAEMPYQEYERSVHGKALYQDGLLKFAAVCTDCHGVHDIRKADDPGSRVMQANLVKTCQQCHSGATENFPAAWLSHYEPSWQHAPLVYAVKLFYAFVIPFIMGGLVLQILLHLWRVVVNR